MLLVQVRARLLSRHQEGVCHKTPFLGGILHGVVASKVRDHAPEIAHKLGMMESSGHGVKRYRVLPPAYNAYRSRPLVDQHYSLEFGVLLYNLDMAEAQCVAQVLAQHWHGFDLKPQSDRVVSVSTAVLPIDLGYQVPSFTQAGPLRLTFESPLQLKTLQSAGINSPQLPAPSLLTLVRSVKNKVLDVAPDMAHALGMHKEFTQQTDEWIEAEEAVRSVVASQPYLDSVSWQYGSRTKDHKVRFFGALGTLEFQGELPDVVLTLLNWGTWLGIGEKATFGQGMYLLDEAT